MAFQIRMFPSRLVLGAVIALAACAVPAKTWAQGDKASPKEKGDAKSDERYGDQGGEKVLPATSKAPNTVMRARYEDTFLKISNPRFGQGGAKGKGAKALLIDYEVVSRGKFDGGALVLRADDGSRTEVELKSIVGRDSGIIELVGVKQFGNIKFSKNIALPENLEVYVVRGDDRYDPPSKHMVSNSLVMGKMKTTSKPRDWTTEEIKRYSKPPLAYKNPNAHPDIGEDVPSLPAATGLTPFRYVDPDGRLLGLDYHIGEWEKRTTVWRLAPVYSADQPKQHAGRSMAKKGYAVAGAEVNADKYVLGIRLLFSRVKADGSLDAKDSYAGEWIGTAPEGKATTLINDGRRVLGIHFHQGGIVDRFALVAEDKAK